MSTKYWTKILVGMLVVFGIGLLITKGIGRGKALVMNNFPAALPLFNAGFKVDGNHVGDLQRLQFMRSQPGSVDSAVLTVRTSSPDAVHQLDHCVLEVMNHDQTFSGSSRFTCASSQDSARLDLVPFGHVLILPSQQQMTLYIARDVEARERREAYRGTGGDTGNVDIQHHDGTLSISVNERELVHISGDSAGGSVVIRDSRGHPIVEINGDSNGGSVKITDANGKTRVNLHGTGSSKHDSD